MISWIKENGFRLNLRISYESIRSKFLDLWSIFLKSIFYQFRFFYEFINENLINFNQSKSYNVLKLRRIISIRTHLFVQMIIDVGQYNHKKIQIFISLLRLVIQFKFLNHAIQISSHLQFRLYIRLWHTTVTKSNIKPGVIFQFNILFIMVIGTQMVFMKPSSNARSVGADQKERSIWMISTLLSKMVPKRFRMSQTPSLMSHFNDT